VRIGIDLGGTKIEAIALDYDGGALAAPPRADPLQKAMARFSMPSLIS
jgi:hypothetical protein